jgi:hypothetical protein
VVNPRVPNERTEPISVRATPREKAAIDRAARLADVPPSVYIRDVMRAHVRTLAARSLPRWLPADHRYRREIRQHYTRPRRDDGSETTR